MGDVTASLAIAGINIRALSVADTAEFGILRIIVDDCDKAVLALNNSGFTTKVSDVAALELEDKPGSLAKIMELFKKNSLNIEYLYASLEGSSGKAVVIFKLEDHEKGLELIRKNDLRLLEIF